MLLRRYHSTKLCQLDFGYCSELTCSFLTNLSNVKGANILCFKIYFWEDKFLNRKKLVRTFAFRVIGASVFR
jgi:hypothetical protein